VGLPPRTSDKEDAGLSRAISPQCTTTQAIPRSKRHKEIEVPPRGSERSFDARSIRKCETRQDHLWLEVVALRALLVKTREELLAAQEREKRARYLAFHDDLTSLPNRRYFRERLGLALTNNGIGISPVAVLYLDLDGFKALNDLYGHDTGDALLSTVARRLSHALRSEDLVSRLAGDEYACLISGVMSRKRLQQMAVALFRVVSAPFKIGTLELTVCPSIGIAVSPTDGSTTEELMKAADSAMYLAKRQRSSYAFFRTTLRAVTRIDRDEGRQGDQLSCVRHRTD
jgi:diguanylate cyclase (GGDEF)-like protein